MRPTAGTGAGDATAPGTASTTRSGDLVRAAGGRDPEPSAAVLDAQSIASGEGGQARGFDMAKRTRGRKRHLVVDTLGLVLVVMVTSAAVQDRPADGPSWPGWPPRSPPSGWSGPMAATPTASTTPCRPGRLPSCGWSSRSSNAATM